MKTAAIPEELDVFSGTAHVCESQESAVEAVLKSQIIAGNVIVIRYEGPKSGPGMQELLYSTSYLKATKLNKDCALITDGRFSGGTSCISIRQISPEAVAGGNTAIIKDGDTISINIPNRSIQLEVTEEEIGKRREGAQENLAGVWKPKEPRERSVSSALKMYSKFVKGAVREL